MTEQRDAAIAEQTERAQLHRDQAVALLAAAELIRGLIDDQPSERVKSTLYGVALETEARHFHHLDQAAAHDERAQVLRAHAQASAKGAPYRPVERLGVLTAVKPEQYA